MSSMTPSTDDTKAATQRQVNKAVSNFRTLLEKHATEFDSAAVQRVLGQKEFTSQTFVLFRQLVEAKSSLVTRIVFVNRTRTPQQALDATRRHQVTIQKIVNSMPRGEGKSVKVIFFKPDKSAYERGLIGKVDLVAQYKLRGLKPADPIALCAVNETDPTFANEMPNITHWNDSDSGGCYIVFGRTDIGDANVHVNFENDIKWGDRWWFAGVEADSPN